MQNLIKFFIKYNIIFLIVFFVLSFLSVMFFHFKPLSLTEAYFLFWICAILEFLFKLRKKLKTHKSMTPKQFDAFFDSHFKKITADELAESLEIDDSKKK